MLFSGNFETQEDDVLSLKFFEILWQSLKLHPLLTDNNNNSYLHKKRNQLQMHLHYKIYCIGKRKEEIIVYLTLMLHESI